MIRRTTTAAGGLLVLFHAWLLGSQLWDGQLAEPGLVLRWLVAVGLVGALASLRRSGASIFWGRKAVSIWLLTALLHGPAMASEHGGVESPALPETVTALIQIAAASSIVALGLGLLSLLARSLFASPRARLCPVAVRPHGAYAPERAARLAPRPPPAFSLLVRG